MRKLPLHIWILLALVLGVAYGYISAIFGAHEHVLTFVKPLGDLFLNLLQMIAVPLVLFSLVAGVASLRDASKLARIGGKTVFLYLGTTAVAISLGLLVVNIFEPGAGLSPELRDHLRSTVLAGTSSTTVVNPSNVSPLRSGRRSRFRMPYSQGRKATEWSRVEGQGLRGNSD